MRLRKLLPPASRRLLKIIPQGRELIDQDRVVRLGKVPKAFVLAKMELYIKERVIFGNGFLMSLKSQYELSEMPLLFGNTYTVSMKMCLYMFTHVHE